MKFENTWTGNWEGAMRGMRFPMKGIGDTIGQVLGPKDLDLAGRLWKASETDNLAHSKFLRQIFVSVDISAPLYYWSEMDTYKIGTTANSESTMHKLTKDAKNLTIDDFQIDPPLYGYFTEVVIPQLQAISLQEDISEIDRLRRLKQTLPTSYIQKRHWTANYEVIRNIYNQRRNHRLEEWFTYFVEWVKTLPYAEEFILRNISKEIKGGNYKKRPVAINAFRFMLDDVAPDWFMDAVTANIIVTHEDGTCDIKTLEGAMHASCGDYIIQGVQGEIYPCKPDIFLATYDPA